MLVTVILVTLALLSLVLLLWQFVAAWRFPLHRRSAAHPFTPPVTLLKPLKGCDEHTRECLRSWLTQDYAAPVQVLFGVADEKDPVCSVVRELIAAHPHVDAELVITHEPLGPNAKVANVVQLARRAKHGVVCVSDADVRVPNDLFKEAVAPLRDPGVGLVNCFYQLANPVTTAMRWEAIAVNADFWSQVLQANSLKPQDFALGAVMILRKNTLEKIGGLDPLLHYLADDYQLGRRVAQGGERIVLSPVVGECWDRPMNFAEVWRHQLRWARTIRASQPIPYLFSILSNVTLWALLMAVLVDLGRFPPDSVVFDDIASPIRGMGVWLAAGIILLRCILAAALAVRLTKRRDVFGYWWLTPVKDLLQAALWFCAFAGNKVTWGNRSFRVERGGKLKPL